MAIKMEKVPSEVKAVEDRTASNGKAYRLIHAIDEEGRYGKVYCWNPNIEIESDTNYKLLIKVNRSSSGTYLHLMGVEGV